MERTMTAEDLKALCDKLTTKGLGPRPDFADVDVSPPTFIGKDSRGGPVLCISSEYSVSSYWLDYYGEFRGGYPWINPILEAWAKERGMFWEWYDPSYISLHEL
jgi:hypothetical protein